MTRFALLLLLLPLTACDSLINGNTPPELIGKLDFIGIWNLPDDVDQQLRIHVDGLTGTIDGVFFGTEELNYELDDRDRLTGRISALLAFWDTNTDEWRNGTFLAEMLDKRSLSVEFDFDGRERFGVFELNEDVTEIGASGDQIAGNWRAGNFVTLSYSDGGQMAGNDQVGCSYQGVYSIPVPAVNIYQETIAVTNCDLEANLTGNAVIYPSQSGSDVMIGLWWSELDPNGPRFFLLTPN